MGPILGVVTVVDVVQLRGARHVDFKDDYGHCRACPEPAVHQHHVVFRQHIDRVHGDRWHPDDALALCWTHHSTAHRYRLPLTVLRNENYSFARELLGPGPAYEYLRRRYAGDDSRLDDLFKAT